MNSDARPSPEVSDPKALRRAFGAFATGVIVVTTGGGSPHAMTANSFTSVSLDPPLLLVCIDHNAIMHRRMSLARSFGVSVLAADQENVARHFANSARPLGAAQFDGVDWRHGPHAETPLINGALVTFECALWRSYEGGDHTIFIGELLSVERRSQRDALLFLHGRFQQLIPEPSEVTA